MKELNEIEAKEVNGGFIGLFEGVFPIIYPFPRELR